MVLEVIVDISSSEIDRTFDYEGADCPLGKGIDATNQLGNIIRFDLAFGIFYS